MFSVEWNNCKLNLPGLQHRTLDYCCRVLTIHSIGYYTPNRLLYQYPSSSAQDARGK